VTRLTQLPWPSSTVTDSNPRAGARAPADHTCGRGSAVPGKGPIEPVYPALHYAVVLAASTPDPGTGRVWAALFLGAVLYGIGYSISIRLHPYRRCRDCGESGKHRGAVFARSFRHCRRCGGTGRELRPFARDPHT